MARRNRKPSNRKKPSRKKKYYPIPIDGSWFTFDNTSDDPTEGSNSCASDYDTSDDGASDYDTSDDGASDDSSDDDTSDGASDDESIPELSDDVREQRLESFLFQIRSLGFEDQLLAKLWLLTQEAYAGLILSRDDWLRTLFSITRRDEECDDSMTVCDFTLKLNQIRNVFWEAIQRGDREAAVFEKARFETLKERFGEMLRGKYRGGFKEMLGDLKKQSDDMTMWIFYLKQALSNKKKRASILPMSREDALEEYAVRFKRTGLLR